MYLHASSPVYPANAFFLFLSSSDTPAGFVQLTSLPTLFYSVNKPRTLGKPKIASFLHRDDGVGRMYDSARRSQSCGSIIGERRLCKRKATAATMNLQVASKLYRSPPTLSTFSCLTADSDVVLIERLHSHYKRSDTHSKRSTILRFVLVWKIALSFATYQIPVCQISVVFESNDHVAD